MADKYQAERDIMSGVIDSLEWDYENNQLPGSGFDSVIDEIREYIDTEIDRITIYTSDIMELWAEFGYQELGEYSLSDFDTIGAAISASVNESLRDMVSPWDILQEFLSNYESTIGRVSPDTDPGDIEASILALIEYRESDTWGDE